MFTVRQLFNPETGQRLREDQVLNHFPNHYELTRKDLMVKNIKRYKKEREKLLQQNPGHADARDEFAAATEFVPCTYSLPNDYALFVEEFRRNPSVMWIKPASKAQGKGIFLVSKLQQVKKWSTPNNFNAKEIQQDPYVISRYIDKPLLIGGKKFDLRLYVLVTSFRPLKAYLYDQVFCRFCNEEYTNDVADLDNLFVHLTNVAIQKQSDEYNEQHGGKWSIDLLRMYLESTRGQSVADQLLEDIENVIITSLRAVQGCMIHDKHCFEMYGYDILLDEDIHPWLLEVNASPSLSTTTADDRMLKTRLLNDVLNVVYFDKQPDQKQFPSVCGFTMLVDDSMSVPQARKNKPRTGWR